MSKIQLTESKLRDIIREAVANILREYEETPEDRYNNEFEQQQEMNYDMREFLKAMQKSRGNYFAASSDDKFKTGDTVSVNTKNGVVTGKISDFDINDMTFEEVCDIEYFDHKRGHMWTLMDVPLSKIKKVNESKSHKVSPLNEAQGIQSQKLYDIFKQYGGFGGSKPWYSKNRKTNNNCIDIHNLRDEDIITVMPLKDIKQILNDKRYYVDHGRWADSYGLEAWAKQNGIKLEPGDRIEHLELGDGENAVLIINRNESQVRGREGEGWDAYYQKREKRENDKNWDGKNRYISKYYDPDRSTMWKNPYKRNPNNWSREDIDNVMNGIRQRRNIRKMTGELTGGMRQNY